MATVVTRSGQITLDANIRRELGIEVGTPLEVNRIGDLVMISKKDKNFWKKYKGVLDERGRKAIGKLKTDSTKRFKKLGII